MTSHWSDMLLYLSELFQNQTIKLPSNKKKKKVFIKVKYDLISYDLRSAKKYSSKISKIITIVKLVCRNSELTVPMDLMAKKNRILNSSKNQYLGKINNVSNIAFDLSIAWVNTDH